MRREDYFSRVFPQGIPTLWCPLISHYADSGKFNSERTAAHIEHIAPYVQAYLAPVSTGDGWEMSSEERFELVELLLPMAEEVNGHLLIGVLETGRGKVAESLKAIHQRYTIDTTPAYTGVTVTAPHGSSLSQQEIRSDLSEVLEQGVPTSLYQLPQVTENEIEPSTAVEPAKKYPNFYLFKDTSGEDKVALSGLMPDDLFLVRGAPGGAYSAEAAEATEEARSLSDTLSTVVEAAFSTVTTLPFGNPFANSNKAVDHIMAYGAGFRKAPAPLTHSENRIPADMLDTLSELLRQYDLFPQMGYME